MIFALILVVILITLLVLVQAGIIPRFIKSEGERLRSQVDELAEQLRGQLDRVEAQQRSVTESVVTLRSYTLDKPLAGNGLLDDVSGSERHFFNALVRELSDRLGGRIWIVEDTGRIVGDAAGAAGQHSLSEGDLPMAIPLRSLLAQSGEALRHTTFRSASGEHTLIVQPIVETPWMLAIDVPTRRLGERPDIPLHKPWPLAVMVLVSTLTLLRSLNLHLARMNDELPTLLRHEVTAVRDQSAQLPPLMQEIGEQMAVMARAAIRVGQQNESLLQTPEANANRVAMLADSVAGIVQTLQGLQEAASVIADSSGALVQLASRAYSYSLHQEESIFAVEARNLAQRCARSSKELRALITDAIMQAQGDTPLQNNSVLIEEVYSSANTLLQRTNG